MFDTLGTMPAPSQINRYIYDARRRLSWHLIRFERLRFSNRGVPTELPSGNWEVASMRMIRSILKSFFKHRLIIKRCKKKRDRNIWDLMLTGDDCVPRPREDRQLGLGPRQVMLRDFSEAPFVGVVTITDEQQQIIDSYIEVKEEYTTMMNDNDFTPYIEVLGNTFQHIRFNAPDGDFYGLFKALNEFHSTFIRFLEKYVAAIQVGQNVLDQINEHKRLEEERRLEREKIEFEEHRNQYREWQRKIVEVIQTGGDPVGLLNNVNDFFNYADPSLNWDTALINYKDYFTNLNEQSLAMWPTFERNMRAILTNQEIPRSHRSDDVTANRSAPVTIGEIERALVNDITPEEMEGVNNNEPEAVQNALNKLLERRRNM